MKRTTLRITVPYTLLELKEKYKEFMGIRKTEKVLKSDIANWLAALASADIQ